MWTKSSRPGDTIFCRYCPVRVWFSCVLVTSSCWRAIGTYMWDIRRRPRFRTTLPSTSPTPPYRLRLRLHLSDPDLQVIVSVLRALSSPQALLKSSGRGRRITLSIVQYSCKWARLLLVERISADRLDRTLRDSRALNLPSKCGR